MKKNFTLTFALLLCLFYIGGNAQTQFWSDTFEDAGAPSSGARTPSVAEFICPTLSTYFKRVDLASISLQNGTYSNIQGTKFWAGEDIDKGPGCSTNNAISANQNVTWSVNIAGKSGLSFRGLFAASHLGGWQGLDWAPLSPPQQDFIEVLYRIDGGAWTKALAFYTNVPAGNAASSNTLQLDTNSDSVGDGASLGYAFAEFSANITGTGTTLELRMNCHANGGNQELAVDNFRLLETPPCVPINGTTVVTNVACNSGTNGAINLTPTGGTGPYTFNWGGGITTEDRTGLAAGTYSVTITDANSCTGTVSGITVTQPPVLNGSTVVTNVACNGGNTGAINLTPSGGTPGYTFNWGGGITTEDRTGLAAGTYSVIITDANGCTRTVSGITVTQPTAAVSGTTVVTNVSCFGGNNGAINLTPTGGVGPYTFNWGGGITTEDRTGLAAGTYSVTITDANGCTGTVSPTVTQPAAVVSGTTVVTNIACFGGNTGAINLTPTGGTGPYTFNWGGGITTEDRTGLAVGTYSVTITDVNGCTGTVSPTVTQPAAVVSGTTVVTNIACFGGNTGAINLTPTGGVGPYTFNWGGGITTEDRTGLAAGTYSVTITDANGCTGTVSPTVTQPAAVVSGTTVVTNIACFGGNTGAINLTPTGGTGPYTFNWGGGITTEDRTGLAAGTYSVTITDLNGCTGTVSGITITAPSALIVTPNTQTNVACFGGSNGAAAINTPTGGAGGYTYNWTPGTPTGDGTTSVTGLAAGTYTVTVTDANGCTATQSFTVTAPPALVVTASAQTNVACFGGSSGAAAINTPTGGAGGYTYDWTPGTPTGDGTTSVTGLAAGTYTVTVTDANSCTATQSFTVTAPPALVVTASAQTNVACFGGSNGAAAINTPSGGAGGYTYDWTPGTPTGDGTTSVTGLAAGTYTVTVTDANGCTATQSFTVTAPTAISTATGSQTNVSCNGGTNGSASVTPSGGTPGYTYSWAPSGGTSATATGLAAGTYTVTVTDANGCTATRTYTLTEPTAISTATGSQTNVSCNGGSNGSASVTPSGGTPGYTYSWAPSGGTSASATGLAAGTYTVTVTDANGCTATRTYTLTEPTAIDATTTLVGSTLTANQAGATYQWFECPNTIMSGETGQSFTPAVSGDYKVTVTLGGCSADSSCETVLETDSFEVNSKFVMYPNPSKGMINIKSDVGGDFLIINQLGQTVRRFKVTMDNVNTIDLDNLADGVYFVRGADQTKIKTQRLVIKK